MELVINEIIESLPSKVVAALIVTALVFMITKGFKIVRDTLKGEKYKGLASKYYIYFRSSVDFNDILVYNLDIKKSIGKLKVDLYNDDFKMKGVVLVNDRNIYIKATGVNHPEEGQFTFQTPLHKKIELLFGVYGGISIIGEPLAEIVLISSSELEISTVKKLYEEVFNSTNNFLLKIPNDKSIFTLNSKVYKNILTSDKDGPLLDSGKND